MSDGSNSSDDDVPLAQLFQNKPPSPADSKQQSNQRLFSQLRDIQHGPAKREDKFLLPTLEEGERWTWSPPTAGKIVIMKDAALAASNAIKKVWPTEEVVVGTCAYHASSRWFDTKYKNLESRDSMQKDFEILKNCPHLHLVPILHREMLSKWKTVYKQKKVADEWSKSWSSTHFTRIELNAGNPLLCGFPADNNMVESGNNDDKEFSGRKRDNAVNFIVDILAPRVKHASLTDLKYSKRMKPACHSKKFLQSVYKIRDLQKKNLPCCLTIQYSFSHRKIGVPNGSFLIPSESCLDEVDEVCASKGEAYMTSAKEYEKWMSAAQWPKQYKAIVNGAKIMKDTYDSCFDKMSDWLSAFHVMRPVDLADPRTGFAVRHLLKMLDDHGYCPIDCTELKEREPDDGLLICDCPKYLHYGWCEHTCSFAFHRGIITKYPQNMDPTPLIEGRKKKRAGAPRKAKGGGALKKFG